MNTPFAIIASLIVTAVGSFAFAETKSPSLLTMTDLEGGAVETPTRSFVGGNGSVNHAMLAASEAETQVRRVEIFLKSGPAQNGDLRVVQTSKPGATTEK